VAIDSSTPVSSGSSSKPYSIKTPLSVSNKDKVTNWAKSRGLEYVFQEGALAAIERDLYIAPVEVMSAPGHEKIYGVFSNREILAGERIANYPGQKKKSSQVKKNPSYAYALPGGDWHIDASVIRGTAAFVNSVIDQEIANVESQAEGKGFEAEIYYVATKTIRRGEQLLICYGDDYDYHPEYLRYLNPQHTHLCSKELWIRNMDAYNTRSTFLDSAFLGLFKRSSYGEGRVFMTPVFFEGVEETTLLQENLDLPVLEREDEMSEPLPQNALEGITTLMGLMWWSSKETVLRFLHKGVDLNRLSNLSGVSALHILMKSPNFLEADKILILKEMKRLQAFFGMRDYEEKTPLHYALEARQGWALVEFLINEFRVNAIAMKTASDPSYVLQTAKSDCAYMSPFEPRGMRDGLLCEILGQYTNANNTMRLYVESIFEPLLEKCEPADWIFLLKSESTLEGIQGSSSLNAIFERAFTSLFFPVHMTSKRRLELLALSEVLREAIEPKAPIKKQCRERSKTALQANVVQTWLSNLASQIQGSDCFEERSYFFSRIRRPPRDDSALTFSSKVSTRSTPAPMLLRKKSPT